MNFFVFTAPLFWMFACISYFAITTAEPTRMRFFVAFGPAMLMFLSILLVPSLVLQ